MSRFNVDSGRTVFPLLLTIGAALLAVWALLGVFNSVPPQADKRVASEPGELQQTRMNPSSKSNGWNPDEEWERENSQDRDYLFPVPGGEKRGPTGDISNYLESRSDLSPGVYFNFSGNSSFTDAEIIEALRLPAAFSSEKLAESIRKQVTGFYQARGFARSFVQVGVSESDPAVADVAIEEGRVYILGLVQFQGNSAASTSDLRSFYPVSGETVNVRRLNGGDRQLKRKYQESGYLGATVRGQTKFRTASKQVDYQVDIDEGSQYRVGSVTIPSDYEATFPLKEGDVYFPEALDQFVRRAKISKRNVVIDKNIRRSEVEITIFDE